MVRISDQPMGFLPQPSASAMGFHMAITTGDSTRLSVDPIRSLPYLLCDSELPSLIKALDAGLIMSGWFRPSRTSSIASPEPIGTARTKICLPPLVLWPARLKSLVTSVIHFSFSDPYVKTSSSALSGRATAPPSGCCAVFDLQPGSDRTTAATIAAVTIDRHGNRLPDNRQLMIMESLDALPPLL